MHHTFDIGIATKYDTSVAIFLNNLAFWVQKNMGNEKHFYEGRYWTYNSLDAFSLIFPYWSKDQIRTVIKKCLKHDLILIGNFNKQGYDRTQWFTLTDAGLALFPLMWENHHIKPSLMWENSHMDVVEIPHGCGEIPTPIPDTKTQIENTYTSSSLFDELTIQTLVNFKNQYNSLPEVEEEEFIKICELHVENRDKSQYNLQQSLHGLRKLIAERRFAPPAAYTLEKEKAIKKKQQEEEYQARMKAQDEATKHRLRDLETTSAHNRTQSKKNAAQARGLLKSLQDKLQQGIKNDS